MACGTHLMLDTFFFKNPMFQGRNTLSCLMTAMYLNLVSWSGNEKYRWCESSESKKGACCY